MKNNISSGRGLRLKFITLLVAVMLLVTAFPPFVPTAHAASQSTYRGVVSSATLVTVGRFTYLTLVTNERLTFAFRYTRDAITIRVNRAATLPSTINIPENNPLFRSGSWDDNTLTLNLVARDGFMGYFGFFDDDDNTVIRFRHPPSSISNARIAIDPGHGGRDRGAEGFRRDLPEAVINRQMANLLAAELRSRGATVLLLDTAQGMELGERVRQAERFGADIFISIHNNASARNPAARGTEVFYFTLFSRILAENISREVSTRLDTNNRGAHRRRFAVTRSPRFASVLVEAGFVTNRAEYEKLIDPVYQQQVAVGIANAIAATITQTYPGRAR